MKWSIPVSARTYTDTSGKRQDKALAEELCDLQAVFWAPTSTWSWRSTSGSNRAGWMVQAVSNRKENGHVLLNVRSLHHSDHYKFIVGPSHLVIGRRNRGSHSLPQGMETHPYPSNVSGSHRKSAGSISQPAEPITALQVATYPTGDLPPAKPGIARTRAWSSRHRDGRCFKRRQPRIQSSLIGLPCGSSYRSGNAWADAPSIGRFRRSANSTTNWTC